MKKKLIPTLALILCVVLLCTACGGNAGSAAPAAPAQAQPAAEPAAQPAAEKETIRFAYIAPMTGDSAHYGEEMLSALQMFIDQKNEAGGVQGKLIELDIYDDKNDPKETVNIANKIVESGDVLTVFGPFTSTCAMAAAPIFQENEMIQLAITASHPDFTAAGEWIFRGVRTQATEAVEQTHIVYDLGKRKAAVLYSNNDFGVSVSEIFTNEFTRLGGEVLASESYLEGQVKDFSPMLSKIKAVDPEIVILVGLYNDVATILNQADTLDLNCDFMGTAPNVKSETIELAGENAEGLIALAGFELSDPSERFQNFRAAYKEYSGGTEVNSFIMNAYDAIGAVVSGIEKVGTDKYALRDYLGNLKDYPGIAGDWSYDENRNPSKKLYPVVIKDGQWVLLEY